MLRVGEENWERLSKATADSRYILLRGFPQLEEEQESKERHHWGSGAQNLSLFEFLCSVCQTYHAKSLTGTLLQFSAIQRQGEDRRAERSLLKDRKQEGKTWWQREPLHNVKSWKPVYKGEREFSLFRKLEFVCTKSACSAKGKELTHPWIINLMVF